MVKAFAIDPGLENRKGYAVTRLVHDYTPSAHEEPVSQYSVDQLTDLLGRIQ